MASIVDRFKSYLASGLLFGIYGIAVYFMAAPVLQAVFQPVPDTCSNVSIPFTTETTEDATRNIGDNYTSTIGLNGTKKVCTNHEGIETASEVTLVPVNEVVVQGSKVLAPMRQYEDESYGSTCNDGTRSPSVGRGACSWHGGVAY